MTLLRPFGGDYTIQTIYIKRIRQYMNSLTKSMQASECGTCFTGCSGRDGVNNPYRRFSSGGPALVNSCMHTRTIRYTDFLYPDINNKHALIFNPKPRPKKPSAWVSPTRGCEDKFEINTVSSERRVGLLKLGNRIPECFAWKMTTATLN